MTTKRLRGLSLPLCGNEQMAFMLAQLFFRHGRACCGHLAWQRTASRIGMAGINPAMTTERLRGVAADAAYSSI